MQKTQDQRSCNSKEPLVLRSGDNTSNNQRASPCTLCLMSTAYAASVIPDDISHATHDDFCPFCDTLYVWSWHNMTVGTHGRYYSLDLRMSRSGSFIKPTDDKWLNSLEITGPADPRGDPETKHLLWCDDCDCAKFRKWGEVRSWVSR